MSISNFTLPFLAMLFWFLCSALVFMVALLMYLKFRPLPFITFSIPIYFDGFLISYNTFPFFISFIFPVNILLTSAWFFIINDGKRTLRAWDYIWALLSMTPIQIISLLFVGYLKSLDYFPNKFDRYINKYFWLAFVVPHLIAFAICIWMKFKKRSEHEENSGTSPS